MTLMLVAVLVSRIPWLNSVSALGVFVGSLFIIPLAAVIKPLFRIPDYVLPSSNRHLVPAIILALVVFLYLMIKTEFERHFGVHFVLPFLVVTSCFLTGAGTFTAEKLIGRIGSRPK